MIRYLKYLLLIALPVTLFGLNDTALLIYYYGRIGWYNTNSSIPSLIVGSNNITQGQNNTAIGYSLQNYQPNNLTVGQYNAPVADELFTVGNGSFDVGSNTAIRSNALSASTTGVNIPGEARITSIPAQGGLPNFSGTAPAWWSTGTYKIFAAASETETHQGSDHSPANIGQLKHVASRAKLYFDARFSGARGGAGGNIIAVTSNFSNNTDYYAPVAIGQLKHVAKAFYARLSERGYNWTPPWVYETVHPGNAAPATIGQLKQAFSFDFGAATADTDGDGLTNWAEYDGAGNPTKFDLPVLTLSYAWREVERTENHQVDAVAALNDMMNNVAYSNWEPWPGVVSAKYRQTFLCTGAPPSASNVKSHTFHRREIKVQLLASRAMPVAWQVHLTKLRSHKWGPVENDYWTSQQGFTNPVVLAIPQGGQEAVFTLSTTTTNDEPFPNFPTGAPNNTYDNIEAAVEYQLFSTGTTVPVTTTDTDGDAVPDALETLMGTTLSNPSSSGSGIKDSDSPVAGINVPKTLLAHHDRSLKYDKLPPPSGSLTTFTLSYPFAAIPVTTSYANFTALNSPLLGKHFPTAAPDGTIFGIPLPGLPFISALPPGDLKLKASSSSNPNIVVDGVPCTHATLQHSRQWALLVPPSPTPTTRTFLKVTKRKIGSDPEVVSAVPVVFNFEANKFVATSSTSEENDPDNNGFTASGYTDLIAKFTSLSGPESVNVSLIPIDIEEVISDQIAGNEANKLPTAFYGGQPNNPMLMATRSGSDARLAIKMNVPAANAASIRVGVRLKGDTVIIKSVPSVASPGKAMLDFTAVAGSKTYEVVAGYDANTNAVLEPTEVAVTFQKTPKTVSPALGGGAYTGSSWDLVDKIIIVTLDDFTTARSTTDGYGGLPLSLGFPTAAKMIQAFARGGNTIAGSSPPTFGVLLDASVIPSPDGLSHPLGGKWNAAKQTTTHRLVLPTGSDLSEDVVGSTGLRNMYARALWNHRATLAAAAPSNWGAATITFTDKDFDFSASDTNDQVHAALGKCQFVGSLQVSLKAKAGGGFDVGELNCYGSMVDLYDFAYGAPKVTVAGIDVADPKAAARTQAGYGSLTFAPWPDAGRVFFTEVQFGTGWFDYVGTYPP